MGAIVEQITSFDIFNTGLKVISGKMIIVPTHTTDLVRMIQLAEMADCISITFMVRNEIARVKLIINEMNVCTVLNNTFDVVYNNVLSSYELFQLIHRDVLLMTASAKE